MAEGMESSLEPPEMRKNYYLPQMRKSEHSFIIWYTLPLLEVVNHRHGAVLVSILIYCTKIVRAGGRTFSWIAYIRI